MWRNDEKCCVQLCPLKHVEKPNSQMRLRRGRGWRVVVGRGVAQKIKSLNISWGVLKPCRKNWGPCNPPFISFQWAMRNATQAGTCTWESSRKLRKFWQRTCTEKQWGLAGQFSKLFSMVPHKGLEGKTQTINNEAAGISQNLWGKWFSMTRLWKEQDEEGRKLKTEIWKPDKRVARLVRLRGWLQRWGAEK